MAEHTNWLEKVQKVGVILFLGGFLFASPLAASIGAVTWGAITITTIVHKDHKAL